MKKFFDFTTPKPPKNDVPEIGLSIIHNVKSKSQIVHLLDYQMGFAARTGKAMEIDFGQPKGMKS